MRVRNDDHCPKCGMKAQCVTHNIAEILVYVCDHCDIEWPVDHYEEDPTIYPPQDFLNSKDTLFDLAYKRQFDKLWGDSGVVGAGEKEDPA